MAFPLPKPSRDKPAPGLRWERAYFDHRLPAEEDHLPVFLNPYRAKLLPAGKPCPSYYRAPDDWAWFSSLTNAVLPNPNWLL